jgi:histidinol-phosphate aminotransferase
MGLRDYYRQFDDIDEEELNRARRARRARERELALQRVPDLDLSRTDWPDVPISEVVKASIHTALDRANGYPDRSATRIRHALAGQIGIRPEQIVLGNGAAELLQTALLTVLSEGDELLMPWPSYPLYPRMAARAGARPVSLDTGPAGAELEPVRDAVGERTRAIVICNPNDPTGTYLPAETLARLLAELPARVQVLLDEALVHFQDAEEVDACLRLVETFPSLLVFRTFSKIYGLSGLRTGYAVGSSASTSLLEAIAPVHGVNALTQSVVEDALRIAGPEIEHRRRVVIRERAHLLEALKELPVEPTESQANFIWLRARDMSGSELARRLEEQGVIVAPGGPLGSVDHVRATIRNAEATERLLEALKEALKP